MSLASSIRPSLAASSRTDWRSRSVVTRVGEASTTSRPAALSRSITAGRCSARNGARFEHTISPT